MAKASHMMSFRLSGEGRELLALLARLDGITMTAEIEKLIRDRVDRVAREGKG